MNNELLMYFNGDELAASTWKNKYALEGEITPNDMHMRLAKEFSRIEYDYCKKLLTEKIELDNLSEAGKKYYHSAIDIAKTDDQQYLTDNIYNLFKDFKYIVPGGSIMATLGSDKLSSLSNCFVIDQPKDSVAGIMRQINNQAQLMKYRGGVGFDMSSLRPSGSDVKNSAKTSTGPPSFMDLFSTVTNTIAQDGRRGALMLTINIAHPDSEEVIMKKQDLTKVTGANISIQVTDEFMKAVKADEDFILSFPLNFKLSHNVDIKKLPYNKLISINSPNKHYGYIKKIKAVELWNKLIKCAWSTAEPGILFIDRIHQYSPDGVYDKYKAISTNPCGEIPMGPYDSCRLIHTNLTSCIENPFTKEAQLNDTKLYEICYSAMRLADSLIDLEIEAIDKILNKVKVEKDDFEITLWEKIKINAVNVRRTGVGFTGLADVFAMLNIPYSSKEALAMIDQIGEIKMGAELDCTIDLAVLRGKFPEYKGELEYEIDDDLVHYSQNEFYRFLQYNYSEQFYRMYIEDLGRRNISWSTIAPTGTVSIMTKTSSGIEPIFAAYYVRRRKCSSPTDKVDFIDLVGEKYTEFYVLHPAFKEWIFKNYNWDPKDHSYIDNLTKEDLKQYFEESPWYGSTSSEIDSLSRIKLQGSIQKYITHAISSTLNLPKETTEADISRIYLLSWNNRLKGVTIYRDGSREGILNNASPTQIKPEEGRQALKRPKILEADYYQVKSKGQQYIVLVGLLNNNPYEIFTFKPTTPVEIKTHKGTITKIKKNQYAYDSEFIHIDNLELSTESIEEKACCLYTSMLLRHNADIKFIIKTAEKVDDNITSFSSAMCRILRKYTKSEEVKGEVCPDCGGKLIRESGCIRCIDCNYSKCS